MSLSKSTWRGKGALGIKRATEYIAGKNCYSMHWFTLNESQRFLFYEKEGSCFKGKNVVWGSSGHN